MLLTKRRLRDERSERKIKSNSLDHFRFMKLIRHLSGAKYERLEFKGEAVVRDIFENNWYLQNNES